MYVLSAVRTPIGLINGYLSEFSAGQLIAIVIREALERAVVPIDDVEKLFMGCALDKDFDNEIIKRIGLRKSTKIPLSKCSLESFITACQSTQQHKNVHIVCGVETMSRNSLFKEQNSLEVIKMQFQYDLQQKLTDVSNQKSSNFNQDYILQDELAKIVFRKKGHQIIVTEDEQMKCCSVSQNTEVNPKSSLLTGDGASAAVIASAEYVNKNLLTPLAEIVSYVSATAKPDENMPMTQTIRKALDVANIDCQSISMWEINPVSCNILSYINHFNISPSLVNKSGNLSNIGHPIGMYGGKMISRVIHSLSPGEFGCVAGLSINGTSSTVIFKKLCSKISAKPELILYTKKECPLCDDLERQLEPYKDRFSLQKIDIELNENKKLKTLYTYEIPVLFLDGIFICKHRLDLEYFIRRLKRSEEIVLNKKNE